MAQVKPPSATVRFLAERLQEHLDTHDRGEMSAFALRSGVTKSVLSRLLRGIGAGSAETQRKIAAELGLPNLENAVRRWERGEPWREDAPARTVERVDRYASRTIAAAFARAAGEPEAAIVATLAVALDSDQDPGPQFWLDEIRATARAARKVAPTSERDRDVAATKADATRPKIPRR